MIEMTRGESCDDTMHMCPIGMFETSGFEISDITIQQYNSYAIQPYQCDNGLIKNITIKDPTDRNGDGISMVNCQNIRVTGCSLTTSDDTVYVCSAYRDPRKGYWCSSEHPQPSQNIEIDNNICRLTNLNCKTFAFIPWGASAPDLREVEISNIYVHDNDFQTIGIWPDDPYDSITAATPIKQVRFENNQYTKVQDNFYSVPCAYIPRSMSRVPIMSASGTMRRESW